MGNQDFVRILDFFGTVYNFTLVFILNWMDGRWGASL